MGLMLQRSITVGLVGGGVTKNGVYIWRENDAYPRMERGEIDRGRSSP
jgi:hypothetical protein